MRRNDVYRHEFVADECFANCSRDSRRFSRDVIFTGNESRGHRVRADSVIRKSAVRLSNRQSRRFLFLSLSGARAHAHMYARSIYLFTITCLPSAR